MNIIEKKYIGELRLDGKVDITDPCYDKDVWCRMTTECTPGYYTGYAEISDEGEWGKRVASISIYLNNREVPLSEMKEIGDIGVDAGLAGFFRDKPDYPGDEWSEFLHKAGLYTKEGNYDYGRNTYIVDYGIFSSSGYGDGGYLVYANKDKTAFTIVFIEEENEDEYDEEDEE